jgi:hypothetical protein
MRRVGAGGVALALMFDIHETCYPCVVAEAAKDAWLIKGLNSDLLI